MPITKATKATKSTRSTKSKQPIPDAPTPDTSDHASDPGTPILADPDMIHDDAGIPPMEPEPPSPTPSPPTKELTAHCSICGKGVKSKDWTKVAAWFGEHFQSRHPTQFTQLFQVASAFLALMISGQYDMEPEWADQEAVEVMREELMQILEGDRDPLKEGLS